MVNKNTLIEDFPFCPGRINHSDKGPPLVNKHTYEATTLEYHRQLRNGTPREGKHTLTTPLATWREIRGCNPGRETQTRARHLIQLRKQSSKFREATVAAICGTKYYRRDLYTAICRGDWIFDWILHWMQYETTRTWRKNHQKTVDQPMPGPHIGLGIVCTPTSQGGEIS